MKNIMILAGSIVLFFCGCTSEHTKMKQQTMITPVTIDATSELRDQVLSEYSLAMLKKRSPEIKLLTWNIIEMNKGKTSLTLDKIIEILIKEEPDFIALQGVDRSVKRSNDIDQVLKISEALGMQYYFSSTMKIDSGETGNVLFTKYPIEQAISNRLKSPGMEEPRVILDVDVRIKEILLVKLITTAFDTQKPEVNSDTIKHTYQFIDPQAGILFGDFNTKVSEKVLNDLKRNWTLISMEDADEVKEQKLQAHVFIRPQKNWKVRSCRFLDVVDSLDKKPLIVDLKYLPEDN